jgi:hypothetical protein
MRARLKIIVKLVIIDPVDAKFVSLSVIARSRVDDVEPASLPTSKIVKGRQYRYGTTSKFARKQNVRK